MNVNLQTLSMQQFKALPLVVEGESKEVRYAGKGMVVIRLKPTVYSFTHNRNGEITGSDTARLRAIKALIPVLENSGVKHTYLDVSDKWILSRLVLQPELAGEELPFRPSDLNQLELAALPKAPPIEVVAKKVHTGTPKHRYYKFDLFPTRTSHTKIHSQRISPETPYPETVIRFDWRNPLVDNKGARLADEVMGETMANWFIDVQCARQTALLAFTVLSRHLEQKGLDLWDICFFITEDGKQLFGEVSPDCLRVRAKDGSPLDKDIWRSGGTSEDVLQKWQKFVELLEKNA